MNDASFVLFDIISECGGQTDGQTDRETDGHLFIAIPAWQFKSCYYLLTVILADVRQFSRPVLLINANRKVRIVTVKSYRGTPFTVLIKRCLQRYTQQHLSVVVVLLINQTLKHFTYAKMYHAKAKQVYGITGLHVRKC